MNRGIGVGVHLDSEPSGHGLHAFFHRPAERIRIPVKMKGGGPGFAEQFLQGGVGLALAHDQPTALGLEIPG